VAGLASGPFSFADCSSRLDSDNQGKHMSRNQMILVAAVVIVVRHYWLGCDAQRW
jgi:hypothetical protein